MNATQTVTSRADATILTDEVCETGECSPRTDLPDRTTGPAEPSIPAAGVRLGTTNATTTAHSDAVKRKSTKLCTLLSAAVVILTAAIAAVALGRARAWVKTG